MINANWIRQLFEGRCRLCRAAIHDHGICAGCKEDLPWISAACRTCGLPLVSRSTHCAACIGNPPPFARTIALWRYDGDIPALIQAYKFREDFSAGRLLAALANEALMQRKIHLTAPLIPMPLHPKRRRARGLDHTQMLAKWLNQPLGPPLVKRVLHTPPQSGLDALARANNLAGAFKVISKPPRRVTLFDDVFTTGASAREAAHTLKAAGAETVECLILARAI